MKDIRAPLHKRLIFWLIMPLTGVLFLFVIAFHLFLLSPIKDYIESNITDSMHESVNDIYRVCELNFMHSYHLGAQHNEKEIRIRKAYTLGAIEDFMRRQDIKIYVHEDDRTLLAPEGMPELADKVKEISSYHYNPHSRYMPINLDGKDYYVEHIDFDPWNWQICALRESQVYAGLFQKLYFAYGVSFLILLTGALLVFFFIKNTIYKPIKEISVPLKRGEKQAYQGIFEFEYLSNQLQRALDEQKIEHQKYQSLVESSPMGIFIYRLENEDRLVFTGANQAANDILNVDCRQFVGKTIEEAFPPLADTEIPEHFKRACSEGINWFTEHNNYKDNGIEGVYEIYAFQISPGMMAAMFNDVTNRLKLEEEVQQAKKIESIGILAGGIAHDFNNLLTGILGNISLAKRFVSQEDKVYKRLAATEKATNRAQNLTYQLLTFARGGAPITKPTSIDQLIKESVMFTMSGAKVNCSFSFAEKLWPVEVDAGQVGQVMQNIATNALQAMQAGGNLHINIENYETTRNDGIPLSPGKYLKISLTDEGEGIPAEQIDKIFDPFFTTKTSGTGLGLAICYSIIKKHQGLITVESSEGSGTTFHVYLPASMEKVLPTAQPIDEAVPKGQGRILVMDDNDSVREIASDMLSHAGYKVELATDGLEAIEYYQNAMDAGQTYDLVILDLTVPGGMGGRETIEELQKIDPQVKGIVSSGYSNDSVMTEFIKYGFKCAVTKPYTLENLSRAVHSVLGKSKQAEKNE